MLPERFANMEESMEMDKSTVDRIELAEGVVEIMPIWQYLLESDGAPRTRETSRQRDRV